MEKEKSGQLDKAAFVAALPDAFFPPGFPQLRPQQVQIPERYVTEGLFGFAESDGDGIATKESLTTSFGKSFASQDTRNRGKLDGRSLHDGLQDAISRTPVSGESPAGKRPE
jgi:hypothetical protein